MTDTDALIELLGKVTPMPWFVEEGVEDNEGEFYVCHSATVCDATTVCNPHIEPDARLIALAPDLAREVIALRAEIAMYRKAMPLPATNPVCGFGTGDVQVVGNEFSIKLVKAWAHDSLERVPALEREIIATRRALTPTTGDKPDHLLDEMARLNQEMGLYDTTGDKDKGI